jgi:hypothetical protein
LPQDAVICYLDEKSFYLNSRRKWAKHLPWAAFEAVEADQIRVRRVMNRRHPTKTMFMGVLICPIPEQNFNRLIVMKWLSHQHVLQQDTHWQQFSIDYDINKQLKNGEWRQLHDDPKFITNALSAIIIA